MVDLARLAGLEHEARVQARALAHEVLVDGGDGEQRRDRRALGGPTWRSERMRTLTPSATASWASSQSLASARAHAVGAVVDRPRDVDRVRAEDLVVDVAQRLELVVAQDRLVEDELVRVLGRLGRAGCARAPMPVPSDMTIDSRIGSIGGFVTCAKSCLK